MCHKNIHLQLWSFHDHQICYTVELGSPAAKSIYLHQVVVKESTVFICRAPSKKNGKFVLKDPNSLVTFRKGFLKATFGIRTAKDLTLF